MKTGPWKSQNAIYFIPCPILSKAKSPLNPDEYAMAASISFPSGGCTSKKNTLAHVWLTVTLAFDMCKVIDLAYT